MPIVIWLCELSNKSGGASKTIIPQGFFPKFGRNVVRIRSQTVHGHTYRGLFHKNDDLINHPIALENMLADFLIQSEARNIFYAAI